MGRLGVNRYLHVDPKTQSIRSFRATSVRASTPCAPPCRGRRPFSPPCVCLDSHRARLAGRRDCRMISIRRWPPQPVRTTSHSPRLVPPRPHTHCRTLAAFSGPLVWALPSPFRLSSGSRLTVHRCVLRRPDGADALPRALVPCVLTGLLQAELSLRLALHLAARIPQPLEGRLAGSDGHAVAAVLAFHLRLRITVTPPTTPSTHPHFEENKAASGCLRARCLSLTEVLRAAVQVGLPSACGFAIGRHRAVLVTVLGLGVCCALTPLHWIPRQKRCDTPTPPSSST